MESVLILCTLSMTDNQLISTNLLASHLGALHMNRVRQHLNEGIYQADVAGFKQTWNFSLHYQTVCNLDHGTSSRL